MKSVRTRIAAVVVVLAGVTVGLIATQVAPAGANPLTYSCTGSTSDVAGSTYAGVGGNIFTGFYPVYANVSTAQLLSYLQGLVSQFGGVVPQNPQLTADVTATDANLSYPSGTSVTRHFTATVALPSDLATQASTYLGISSVDVRNSTISMNASSASPGTSTSVIADQSIPLVAGQTIVAPITTTVSLTGASGFNVYTPGSAHVELLVPGGTKHISAIYYQGNYIGTDINVTGLRFDCGPLGGPQFSPTVGYDSITGGTGPTTTTLAPTTTTTQAATTTTTLAPTTTTTTLAPTTTTTTLAPTTTTTTLAPTTTTTTLAPTTTTTLPGATTTTTQGPTTTTQAPPAQGSVSVSIDGAGYSASGQLTSGSFGVNQGVSVSGGGTLVGPTGGTATVSANVNTFLFWSFGTVTVSDPAAGLAPVSGFVLFGPPTSNNINAFALAFDASGLHVYTIHLTIN